MGMIDRCRRPLALMLAALCTAVLLAACSGVGTTRDGLVYVDVSQEELQASLASNFPVRECTFGIACARFSDPWLQLAEGANRVHFSSELSVEFLRARLPGRIALSATPRWDPASAAMYLADLRIEQVTVAGVPAEVELLLRERGGPLLQPAFDRRPVYRVQGEGLRDALIRRNLRGVSVVDGKLRATFAFGGVGADLQR
jgi:hypothetical protein